MGMPPWYSNRVKYTQRKVDYDASSIAYLYLPIFDSSLFISVQVIRHGLQVFINELYVVTEQFSVKHLYRESFPHIIIK